MANEELKITITARADQAEQEMKALTKLADELTQDELDIVIRAKADAAEAEIKRLSKELLTLSDPVDIKVAAEGITAARSQIEDLQRLTDKPLEQKVEVTGADEATRKVGDLGKSADSSKSVLANMVGNATQDLGALGGLAGSAGVAIGQMGEYMADARASGEGFGSIVTSFAKVAGPIALLSVGIGIATSAISKMKQAAQESAERTKEFGEAMKTAADDSVGLAEALRENETAFDRMENKASGAFGSMSDGLEGMLEKLPKIGKFWEDSFDVTDVMTRANVSVYDLAQEMENGAEISGEFAAQLQAAKDAGLITGDEVTALTRRVEGLSKETEKAADKQALWNVDLAEANALLSEQEIDANPLEHYTGLWERLMGDMADGSIDTNTATEAVNDLAEALGKTPAEIIAIADAELDKEMEDITEATNLAGEAARNHADDLTAEAEAHSAAAEAAKEHLGIFQTYAEAVVSRQDAEADLAETLKDEKSTMQDQRDAILEVADARVQEARLLAESRGEVFGAAQELDAMNANMLSLASTTKGPTRDALIEFISNMNGIEPVKVTEILALMDEGKIAEAQTAITTLTGAREVAVTVDLEKEAADAALLDVTSAEYVAYMELGPPDTGPATAAVDGVKGAAAAPVTFELHVNQTPAEDEANAWVAAETQKVPAKRDLGANTKPADKDSNAWADAETRKAPVERRVGTDHDPADKDSARWESKEESKPPVEKPVGADMSEADREVDRWENRVESSSPARMPVDANTNQADNELAALRRRASVPITIPVRLGPTPRAPTVTASPGPDTFAVDTFAEADGPGVGAFAAIGAQTANVLPGHTPGSTYGVYIPPTLRADGAGPGTTINVTQYLPAGANPAQVINALRRAERRNGSVTTRLLVQPTRFGST